jgi:hypothetical protein
MKSLFALAALAADATERTSVFRRGPRLPTTSLRAASNEGERVRDRLPFGDHPDHAAEEGNRRRVPVCGS